MSGVRRPGGPAHSHACIPLRGLPGHRHRHRRCLPPRVRGRAGRARRRRPDERPGGAADQRGHDQAAPTMPHGHGEHGHEHADGEPKPAGEHKHSEGEAKPEAGGHKHAEGEAHGHDEEGEGKIKMRPSRPRSRTSSSRRSRAASSRAISWCPAPSPRTPTGSPGSPCGWSAPWPRCASASARPSPRARSWPSSTAARSPRPRATILTATVKADLEKTNFDRQQALWDKRISAGVGIPERQGRLLGGDAAGRPGPPEAVGPGAERRRGRDVRPEARRDHPEPVDACAATNCGRRSPAGWSSARSTSAPPSARRAIRPTSTRSPTSPRCGSSSSVPTTELVEGAGGRQGDHRRGRRRPPAARARSSSSARSSTPRRARPGSSSPCRTRTWPGGPAPSSPPRSRSPRTRSPVRLPKSADPDHRRARSVVFVRTPEGFETPGRDHRPGRRRRLRDHCRPQARRRDRGRQLLRPEGRARQGRSRPRPLRAPAMISTHPRLLRPPALARGAARRCWRRASASFSLTKLPIDAVPDITNNQVQINTAGARRSRRSTSRSRSPTRSRPRSPASRAWNTRARSRATASRRSRRSSPRSSTSTSPASRSPSASPRRKTTCRPGPSRSMGPISTGLGEIYMWSVHYAPADGAHGRRRTASRAGSRTAAT